MGFKNADISLVTGTLEVNNIVMETTVERSVK